MNLALFLSLTSSGMKIIKPPDSTGKVLMNNSLIPVALKQYHEQNLEKALRKGFILCWWLWMSQSQRGWGKTVGTEATGVNVSRGKRLPVIMVPQSGNILPGPSEETRHGGTCLGVLGDRTGRMLRNTMTWYPGTDQKGLNKWATSVTASHLVIPS